jgi:hypothetical protein
MASGKCLACAGSGTVVGLGMMASDCRKCEGDGIGAIETSPVLDKRSAHYRQAIKKIMESGVSKDEAARIFDEEFNKL